MEHPHNTTIPRKEETRLHDRVKARVHDVNEHAQERLNNVGDQIQDRYEQARQSVPMSKDWFKRNQRLDGHLVEAEIIPYEERTKIQKVAVATCGVVSPASALTWAGHFGTNHSLDIYGNDSYVRSFAEFVVGRTGDVADGVIAKLLRIRSSFGAFSDSGGDGIMMTKAVLTMVANGDMSLVEANRIIEQRLMTIALNTGVQIYGGIPNPNKAAKISLFALSQRVGLKMGAKALDQFADRRSVTAAQSDAELVAHIGIRLSALAIHGLSKTAGVVGTYAGDLGIAEYREDYRHAKTAFRAKKTSRSS